MHRPWRFDMMRDTITVEPWFATMVIVAYLIVAAIILAA